MPVTLLELVGQADYIRLQKSADAAQRVENQWVFELEKLKVKIQSITRRAITAGEQPDVPVELFEEFFFLNAIASWGAAIEHEQDSHHHIDQKKLAAKRIADRTPRTMREVRELYDAWRQKKLIPKRQRAQAEKIRRLYLKKIGQYVGRINKPMIEGDAFERDARELRVQKVADVVYARAKTIVQTETTRNFNGARRAIYDASPDVTHYLFVPLRDFATTPWCVSRRGLVYKKGDPLLDRETPPCHWGCRSELLPLSPHNASHLRLINDKSRARRNHTCVPLPPGWNKAA